MNTPRRNKFQKTFAKPLDKPRILWHNEVTKAKHETNGTADRQKGKEMKKAKFVRAYIPKYGTHKELTYIYRGYEYTITDYGMSGMTLAEQHKMEQNRIDSIIELNSTTTECVCSAEEAFNEFWEYVNS